MLGSQEENSELITTFTLTNANIKEIKKEGALIVEVEEFKPRGVFTFLYTSKKILFKFNDEATKEEWKTSFTV